MFGKKFKQERVDAAINFAKAGKLEITEHDVRQLLHLKKRKIAPEKPKPEAPPRKAISREDVRKKWRAIKEEWNDLEHPDFADLPDDLRAVMIDEGREEFLLYWRERLKQ